MENQYRQGNCLKKGVLGQLTDVGGLGKKEGVVFLRGVDTQCTLLTHMLKYRHVRKLCLL